MHLKGGIPKIFKDSSRENFRTSFTFVTFASFTKFVDMFLKIVCWRKYCITRFSFIIFVASMAFLNVLLKVSCLRKWFATRFTFVVFMAIMNCVDVLLQTSCFRKWFTTNITFMIFAAFMNAADLSCGCVSLNLNLEKMICQLPISYFLLVYNVEDAQIVLLEAILMEQLWSRINLLPFINNINPFNCVSIRPNSKKLRMCEVLENK